MISLIGITGPAQNGKDTVGKMLMKHMPAAIRFAFADKIKEFLLDFMDAPLSMEECKEGTQVFLFHRKEVEVSILNVLHGATQMFAMEPEEAAKLWIDTMRENHQSQFAESEDGTIYFTSSWRKLFQLTGTDWGRQKIHESFWIEPSLPDHDCIVTDVRGHGDSKEHRNIEAQAVINRGGLVIRVVDPRKGSVVRNHASEAGIEEQYITHTIENSGTLKELQAKVDGFLYTHLLAGKQ